MIIKEDFEYIDNKIKGRYYDFKNNLEIIEYLDGSFSMEDAFYEMSLNFLNVKIPKIVYSLEEAISWCDYYKINGEDYGD